MSNEFVREERYIVFKMSDLGNSLKGDEIRRLAREYAEQRRLKGKKPLECVVVEKDWPEYEPTWKAIEARVSGAQLAPNAVAYLDIGVGGYMDIGTDLTDEELDAIPKGRHMLGIVGTYGIDGYVPAQPAPSIAEQDRINAEAAIRSIYGARPNDEALWQTIVNGMITPAHIAQAVADGTITSAYIMQPAPSVPEGFSREDLEAVAAGLDGYEKTVNVGNVTGEGDDHLESTTAYAARFIRAMLAAAPEAKQ